MIKRTIKYINFDGEKVSEEATFHASKTDLLIITTDIEKLQETDDMALAFPILKNILVNSYGVRKGELFVQDEATKDRLRYTPMLDSIIFDLLRNPKDMVKFIVGLLPNDISKQLHTTKEGVAALEEVNKAIDDAIALEKEVTEPIVEEE